MRILAWHCQWALEKWNPVFRYAYLKLGRGDPCAGQSMERAVPTTCLKEKESLLLPNLGLALPMGSKKDIFSLIG